VMDPDEGMKFAATMPDAEYLLILRDGSQRTSPGWRGLESATPAPLTRSVFGALAQTPAAGAGAPGASSGAWDPGFELVVNLEVASVGGGRAKRPFVAVWLEDKDGFPVRTLALWYHGPRWLPELRGWSHADQMRELAEGASIRDTVSSATRGPGKYSVKWDGKDGTGHWVNRGRYTLVIEAAREHGTHQLIRQEVECNGTAVHRELAGNVEVAAASFDYRRKGGTR
jgi:FAD:protein FMN transferase